MLLFALVVIPLAYISLPILVLHNVASRTQTGRYYWKLSVYVGSLVVVSTWGVFIAVGMTLAGLRHDVNYVVARTFYALTSRALGITVEIEGEEHLQTRPAVMVANHQSMLDVLWLGRMFPRKASITAKREVQWTPLGPWMFMSGAVFIDRGSSANAQKSLAVAGEEMKSKGISLLMYPEGTRHNEEEPSMLPFKKGAFHLAVQAGIPIIPVVCENYWKIYHKGVFETGTIKLRVLAPIPTAGLAAVDVIELAARVRDQMVENLREISVGLPNTQAKAASQEFEPELTPSPIEYADQGLIVTNEIVAEVQYSPSEGTSEASASEIPRCARVLKLDGSVSEFGAETDEEGNVLVERRDH